MSIFIGNEYYCVRFRLESVPRKERATHSARIKRSEDILRKAGFNISLQFRTEKLAQMYRDKIKAETGLDLVVSPATDIPL